MSTKPPTPERDALYERSYLYAALHDSFAPLDAVTWAAGGRLPDDLHLISEVMSLLRPHCTPDTGGATGWAMRPAARHYALDETRMDRDIVAAFQTDLANARLGRGVFAPDALDARIASGDSAPDLPRIAGTLDRAGPHAPGITRVVALRALINRAGAADRAEALRNSGLEGREPELRQIAAAIAAPQSSPPLQAVVVSGGAGIGKSSLLDLATERARHATNPVVIRLDFARVGLDPRDAGSFYNEISRQLGDALPDLAADMRSERLTGVPAAQTADTQHRAGIIPAMARAITAADRPLLIVLDGMETLRAEGESRIPLLFERLDRLSHEGLSRIAILAAGEGNFMQTAPDRVLGPPILLEGLSAPAARAVLATKDVPQLLRADIVQLAQGIPPVLNLAARAALEGVLSVGDLTQGTPLARVVTTLYRNVMAALPEDTRQLAEMSLLLRETNRMSLSAVLAPVVTPGAAPDRLEDAFTAIAAQDGLVTLDERTGILRHEADMRRAVLPMIYADAPDVSAAIDARAQAYFAREDRPDLALYHGLQLMRAGQPLPEMSGDIARRLPPEAAEDLIPEAREALRQAQGLRSGIARAGQVAPLASAASDDAILKGSGPLCHFDTERDRLLVTQDTQAQPPDPRALHDLARALAGHDLREAEYILQHGLTGDMPATSPAARLVLCHLWSSGRWSSAKRLFDLLPEGALDTALAEAPALEGRFLLDIWAEFRFDRLVARLREDAPLARKAIDARMGGGRAGLSGGALDFALLTALPRQDLPRDELELAVGIVATHGGDDWTARQRLRPLAQGVVARFGLPVGAVRDDAPVATPEEIAVLNPYARRQRSFLLRPPRGALADFIAAGQTLPQAAALRYPPPYALHPDALPQSYATPRDLVSAFQALGLAADWAEGFTLFNPVADLPLLAQSAERWRRLAAGDWPYGRSRPPGWVSSDAPDPTTKARATALLEADDTGDAARDDLLFWSRPTHDAAAAMQHLRRRYQARYTACLAALPDDSDPETRLSRALRHLLADDITSIAAAPLAVLAARHLTETQAFFPTNPQLEQGFQP